ncbi:MAG: NERD domain-containing protein [Selenomonadaceae bacterium]
MEYIISLVISLWWLWAILIVLAICRACEASIKGFIGELQIKMVLSSLPKDKYIVLHDIMLHKDDSTTQIDHIVISTYGIYIIETKNYTGWIIGSEKDNYWTQTIYRKKSKFLNPIHQNYGHIKTIEGIITAYSFLPVKSIIAFSSRCELKVSCNETPVMYIFQVGKYIKDNSKTEIVPFSTVEAVARIITDNNITDKKLRKQHIKSTNKKVEDIDNKIKSGICPRCGGHLIKRKGRYGEFTGCDNYPKCRYMLK